MLQLMLITSVMQAISSSAPPAFCHYVAAELREQEVCKRLKQTEQLIIEQLRCQDVTQKLDVANSDRDQNKALKSE